MERLTLACGGNAVNSFDDLDEDDLGFAQSVYEYQIEDDKFTFVEGLKNPLSCSILITGPNDHTIYQIRDAVKDGMRSVLNVLEDRCVVPGAGAFEVAAHSQLVMTRQTQP